VRGAVAWLRGVRVWGEEGAIWRAWRWRLGGWVVLLLWVDELLEALRFGAVAWCGLLLLRCALVGIPPREGCQCWACCCAPRERSSCDDGHSAAARVVW
jgi:hypothetical protein